MTVMVLPHTGTVVKPASVDTVEGLVPLGKKKLFLSYGRGESTEFARWIKSNLEACGFICWMDEIDIPSASQWQSEIAEGVLGCDCLVAVLNKKYLSSIYCSNELAMAQSEGKIIAPILFRDFQFTALSPSLRFCLASVNCVPFPSKSTDSTKLETLVAGIANSLHVTSHDILKKKSRQRRDQSAVEYDGFVSYRVWCESNVAEKLFLSLKCEGLHIFWDKECLQDGADWEECFKEGLTKSRKVIALISEKALDGFCDKALTGQDNVLMEWELAVDKLEAGESDYIVPVLVGEYISLADGSKELKKFGAFGGVAGKPWPDEFSMTCKTRTIKQTMQKLFKIQGIHLDPEKVSAVSKDIQAALVPSDEHGTSSAHVKLLQVSNQTDKFQKVLDAAEDKRWKIQKIIGQGTFGAVYKAHDKALRTVALKAMWAHPSVGTFTAKERRLMRREMVAMQRIIHPNVVRLYESHFSFNGAAFWLVLEFVKGDNLRQILSAGGPWAVKEAILCARQCLDAIAYLHSMNIIHRDIKPENSKKLLCDLYVICK
jgi:hypothetical protein